MVTTVHPAPAEHRSQLELSARRPFDWRHSLRFICGFPATHGEQVVDGDHLVKAWRMGDHCLATRIGPGDGEATLSPDAPIGLL